VKSPFRGFVAVLYKEFIAVLRDPMTLFFMFFPPLVEMIAFGYALDNDIKNMSLVVLDQDRTVESRQLVDRFANTGTFRVTGEAQSLDEVRTIMRRGKAWAAVQIPPDFTRELHAGRTAHVQVLIDGSSSTPALQALNTALAVTLRQSVVSLLQESGRTQVPVEVRPQVLYNPALRSPNFFVPGVIGVVLQIATTFASAMSLVRERERGTLETLLVSPLSRWGLMLGKLTPYMCIGLVMAATLFGIMHWLFLVPIAGSVISMFVATVIYVFTLLSMGLLVSTRAQNQMQAMQMSMALILPSVFFSGFIFPRETMPWIFYEIGFFIPTTYFIELMRAIVLRGASLQEFWVNVVVLIGFGIVLFMLSALRFKKKLA
jgi:ABC-2 type transport system permease protein